MDKEAMTNKDDLHRELAKCDMILAGILLAVGFVAGVLVAVTWL